MSLNKINDEDTKKLQLKDVRKTLEFLKTAENNTNKSNSDWESFKLTRRQYLIEYVEFLKTGRKNCITIKEYSEDEIAEKLQHFK